MPLKESQAIYSCVAMCQNTQNMIRNMADMAHDPRAKDELNKAFLSIDACIKQCQTASSWIG